MAANDQPRLTESNIDDAFLVDWLKHNKETIDFITFKQPETSPRPSDQLVGELNKRKDFLISVIDGLHDKLNQQRDDGEGLLTLWKYLLGNAIVYLKLLDNREKYHDAEDFGVERLYKFFESFYEFEGVLFATDDYYRDHVAHMLRVFLLGEYLISTELKFENISVGNENFSRKITPAEKEAMWCIIALTHDLGYALETVPDINKKVRSMVEQFGHINFQEIVPDYQIQPLHKFIIQFISSDLRPKIIKHDETEETVYLNHIQSKYFLKFSGAFERQSHGIISCLVNMRNLVFFLESDYSLDVNKPLNEDDAKQFLIRSTILRAIASHDCEEIYYLKVPQFPFLLVLFDEMQEWDRPRLRDAFRRVPKSTLRVKKFTKTAAEFEIKFTFTDSLTNDEKIRMTEDIKGYFARKSNKIKKILRSAVDGANRDLILTFNVVDTITEVKTYIIVHTNPEDVKITMPQ